jgi:hypothetical protein
LKTFRIALALALLTTWIVQSEPANAVDKPFVVTISGSRTVIWERYSGRQAEGIASLTFKVSPSSVVPRCWVTVASSGQTKVDGFVVNDEAIFDLKKSVTKEIAVSWINPSRDFKLGIDPEVKFKVRAECNNGKRTKNTYFSMIGYLQ